jgi:hypothetical protein
MRSLTVFGRPLVCEVLGVSLEGAVHARAGRARQTDQGAFGGDGQTRTSRGGAVCRTVVLPSPAEAAPDMHR